MTSKKNRTIFQCFEWFLPNDCSFWKSIINIAPYLSKAGFTSIWLPPAYKGINGIDDAGYGIYDLYDLGEFDQKGTIRTKYGTKDEYLDAIRTLHQYDLEVITDIVFNHRMGADEKETVNAVEVNPVNREEDIGSIQSIDAFTKYTFPGRNGKYSDYIWDHTCFDGIDSEVNGHRVIYRFAEKQWNTEVDNEDGNFDFLMGCDLDFANKKVIDELYSWGKWYYDQTQLDGVRLDAVKHIPFDFFTGWLQMMREHSGKEIFAVGEYWNGDYRKLLHYLDENQNTMSLFDVALHFRFFDASNGGGHYDMGSLLNDTLIKNRPENAVTFVDNHDSQPFGSLSSFVQSWFKPLAYAVILLRQEGVPCVFYGDLFGIPHDSLNPVSNLAKLIKLRELYAYGIQHDYFDDQNIIGWTREGSTDYPGSGMAVIMSDNVNGQKRMYMGKDWAGVQMVDALGHQGNSVEIGEDGFGTFSSNSGSVSVWVKKETEESIYFIR